jgi:serine/threonine-protein kinase
MNVLRVGQYRVLRNLGTGGAGDVYLAEDTRLRRKVAIKLVRDADGAASLRREAQCSSMLMHPNIVTLLDFGDVDGVSYLVTEYIEGTPLRKLLELGPMPVTDSLDVAIAVARALAAAHEAWIVHADVKPENVMLRRDGHVKVLDFGVATLTHPHAPRDPLRQPGAVIGTLLYLSPEQVRGDEIIDSRSDLFSLGVMLFEMVTGYPPFAGASTLDLLAAIVEGDPLPVPDHLPLSLHRILERALRKPVHKRYQLATDFAHDLSELRLDLALTERAAGRPL